MDLNYFKLRLFVLEVGDGFSLSQLAAYWDISLKQTKRRLQQYEARGKLHFIPGSGRGHLSQVFFVEDFKTECEMTLKELLEKEDLANLAELLKLPLPASWLQPFYQHFQKHFGLKQDEDEKMILRQLSTRPITTLDPLKVSIKREINVLYQLGDCLTTFTEGKLQAGLAHHWQFQKETTTWSFYLRKGVYFHHGKLFTAEDVVSTFQRILKHFPTPPWQLENLISVAALHPYQVTFTLKAPEPLFPTYLANVLFMILPADLPFNEKHFVGTGAFYLKENKSPLFTLAAFDNYYGLRPLIDEVQQVLIQQPPIAVTPQDEDFYLQAGYKKVASPNSGVQFIMANLTRKTPVQDFWVRKAFYEVCDLTAFPQLTGKVASHYVEKDLQPVKKSLTAAKFALEKADYQGEVLKLGVLRYFYEGVAFAQWLKARCQEIGLNLELLYFSFEDHFYQDFLEKNTDWVLLEDLPVPGEIFPYLAFLASPTLLVQRFLPEKEKKQLANKIRVYKNAPDHQREEVYLAIDNWLISNYFLVYTYHGKRSRYLPPMLAGLSEAEQFAYDYRLAWF